jgi:hypothetical protein
MIPLLHTKGDFRLHLVTSHGFRATTISKWKLVDLVQAHKGQHANLDALTPDSERSHE